MNKSPNQSVIKKKRFLPFVLMFAVLCGLGGFIFYHSNVISYASDDPKACINCHLMIPQYLSWQHSSHREVASCNDCHVPHDNVFSKYFFKAQDGLYHASVFTLKAEPEVIIAKDASVKVINDNCIRCHVDQLTDAKTSAFVDAHKENRTDRLCRDCHREVPHGRVKGTSSATYRLEQIKSAGDAETLVPDWLKKELKTGQSEADKPKK